MPILAERFLNSAEELAGYNLYEPMPYFTVQYRLVWLFFQKVLQAFLCVKVKNVKLNKLRN